MSANAILFSRVRKLGLPVAKRATEGNQNLELLATAARNLESLGFRLSSEYVVKFISSGYSKSQAQSVLTEAISVVKAAVGADKSYEPMYPNFPKQVIEASDAELYIVAIMHYTGDLLGMRILPDYDKADRKPIKKKSYLALDEIGLADADSLGEVFASLLSMKSSFGESERADVAFVVENTTPEILEGFIPQVIPNKENLAALAASVEGELLIQLIRRADTATDLLRIGVVLSGGSATLTGIGVEPVRFVSLRRPIRRAFVTTLEEIAKKSDGKNVVEDALRYESLWKLLAYSLHVGEFKKFAPLAFEAMTAVRNNGVFRGEKFRGFNSSVEALIIRAESSKGEKNKAAVDELNRLLVSRPGVFARRLDKVLRSASKKHAQSVLDAFATVASEVATPVLWQLRTFLANRSRVTGEGASRSFIAKGSIAQMSTTTNKLKKLPEGIVAEAIDIIDVALSDIYSSRSSLGKVFIDPELKSYTVPFGARSASKTLNAVGRGSRIKLDDSSDIFRMFIWWTDGQSRTDLDLSALYLDEDMNKVGTISYYALRDSIGVHSGDITSAPDGASEFIDINVKGARKLNPKARYIAMVVNSYTGQPFDTLPEVFAGVMERTKLGRQGEVFDARTVSNAFDVTSASTAVVPLILDMKEREIIWADLSSPVRDMYANNVANNESSFAATIKGAIDAVQPSLFDIISRNAIRGEVVENSEDADNVFTVRRGTVFLNGEKIGTEKLLSEWI